MSTSELIKPVSRHTDDSFREIVKWYFPKHWWLVIRGPIFLFFLYSLIAVGVWGITDFLLWIIPRLSWSSFSMQHPFYYIQLILFVLVIAIFLLPVWLEYQVIKYFYTVNQAPSRTWKEVAYSVGLLLAAYFIPLIREITIRLFQVPQP